MQRREWLKQALVVVSGAVAPLKASANSLGRPAAPDEKIARLEKPKSEWRKLLKREEYDVLFEEATEPPFTSPLNKEKRQGTYICAACYLPVFSSKAKYDSGTGWPSFYDVIPGRVETMTDHKLIMARTEYHCARCGGHQGHVFDDGPKPTGLRYCNNGVSLKFVPA